jgi:Leucine-rich repeat (LRR) protein
VTVEGADGVPRNIDAVDKLPDEPFQVVFVEVWPGQATSADYLSKLRGLTGLTSVLLHSPPFSDGDFEILASMPNLQQFNLGASRLNGSGFRLLRGSAGIRQITLWGESQIDDQALAEIGSLPNLELLAFASPNVTAAGLRKLKPLPRLRALTVNTNFNSEMVAAIGECEQLTELLALNGTGIVDADLRHLGRLSRLPALWIGQPSITDEGVRALGGLSQLTSLHLTNSRITPAVTTSLNGLAGLKDLSLNFSNLKGIDFMTLKLPLAASISLSNCRLTDDDLRGLAGLPRLQTLFVSDNPLTDAAIDEIAKISTLRKILINGTGITRQGVEQLKRLRPELTVEGGP